MKKIISLIILLVLLAIPLALAVDRDADVTFTVVNPIVVYDVPFSANVNVDSNTVRFIDYDLSVGSSNDIITFGAGLARADQFQFVPALSGPQDNGAFYRVRTETNGNTFGSDQPTRLFTLTNLLIRVVQPQAINLVLLDQPQKSITAEPGSAVTAVTSQPSADITPAISTCGDGVVGYFDTEEDGLRDGNADEQCDTHYFDGNGNLVANPAGSCVQCGYVNADFKVRAGANCNFGSYGCQLEQKTPQEIFIQKVQALIEGKCYPFDGTEKGSCRHPEAYNAACAPQGDLLACNPSVHAENLDLRKRITVITSIGSLLKEYFEAPGIVVPPNEVEGAADE